MMGIEFLTPCPFCKATVMSLESFELHENMQELRKFEVRCCSCFARGPWKNTEVEARAAWENRDGIATTAYKPPPTPPAPPKLNSPLLQAAIDTTKKQVDEIIRPKRLQLARIWIEVDEHN